MASPREWLLVLMLAGCGSESLPPDAPEPEAFATLAERPCPEDSYVGWEDFGGPFVYTWCTGCHSADMPEGARGDAPLGVDFDDVEDVRAWADRIWARAGDQNDTMPPVGGPDEEERALLGEWLACGALE